MKVGHWRNGRHADDQCDCPIKVVKMFWPPRGAAAGAAAEQKNVEQVNRRANKADASPFHFPGGIHHAGR